MKIAMIGCGAYSLALSIVLNEKNDITVWSEDEAKVQEVKTCGYLNKILKGQKIPKDIQFSTNLKEVCLNKKIIILAVAMPFLENTIKELKNFYTDDQVVLVATKGINENGKFAHQMLEENEIFNYAIISGPSFAIDLITKTPTALTVAVNNTDIDLIKQGLSAALTLEFSQDVVGTQLCGALKNIMAIASGMIYGMGFSSSTSAYFLTKALREIQKIIMAFNGQEKTVLNCCGIGDLILTCNSSKSRNYTLGVLLASKDWQMVEKYLQETTVEGYHTLKAIVKLLEKEKIQNELIDILYKIIFEQKDLAILINYLKK